MLSLAPPAAVDTTTLEFSSLETNLVGIIRKSLHTVGQEVASAGTAEGLLCRAVRMCHRAATAASLRLLFRQATGAASSGQWANCLHVSLDEERGATHLSVRLWKSVFTRSAHPFVLCPQRCVF